MAKRIGVLTGGGDCPGLNPAIRGVVLRAAQAGMECVGLREGWKGMMSGVHVPLTPHSVKDLVGKGGTVLGTSRTNPFKKEQGVEKVLETFKNLRLDALVAMGGEDTLGVACRLYQERQFPVVGVPKTMDNDLSATDYTFGFDSAVTVAMDAAARLKDTGLSHGRVMVLEVMGRHAGWVALFTGIAAAADYVCVPERPIDVDDMVAKVQAAHAAFGTSLVVASEAIDLPGESSASQDGLDDFGHHILKERGVAKCLEALLEKKTGIETRSAVIGHIQRGGAPTLFDRILGTRVGVRAAELVIEGRFGNMVALKGDSAVPVSLAEATADLKIIPSHWLALLDTVTEKTGERAAAVV
ncbi:MAG: pyrophosphate--fructose-6-phosphate 1-phosphotransferase [Elusimicrobia bacterium GWA2_69_24]|nr:MAG: pyrophosphate--fructose-6-phosphate 1-phosphotransferase [Elusimicrobia bacterium GWA2_69_24]HBL18128.1 6-phosphofructokinase [Elusimicrobiota bacterium]